MRLTEVHDILLRVDSDQWYRAVGGPGVFLDTLSTWTTYEAGEEQFAGLEVEGHFERAAYRGDVWVPETHPDTRSVASAARPEVCDGGRRVEAGVAALGRPLRGVVQAAWRYSLMSPPQVGCRRIGWPERHSTTLASFGARWPSERCGRCVL
jgi:hypothetical protein